MTAPTELEARSEWRKAVGKLRHKDGDRKGVVARIKDAMAGQPGAQAYDRPRTSGGTTEVWCFTHHGHPPCTDVRTSCDVEIIPSRSDPTGSAAIQRDAAAEDLARLRQAMSEGGRMLDACNWPAAWNQAARAHANIDRYSAQAPSTIARRDTAKANGLPGCTFCARTEQAPGVKRWVPADTVKPTDVKGVLDVAAFVCQWCRKHVASHGRAPTIAECEAHHGSTPMRVRA